MSIKGDSMKSTINNLKTFVFQKSTIRLALNAVKHLLLAITEMYQNRTEEEKEAPILIGCSGSKALVPFYDSLAEGLFHCKKYYAEQLHFFILNEWILTPPEYQSLSLSPQTPMTQSIVVKHLIEPLVESGVISKEQFHSYPSIGWYAPKRNNNTEEKYFELFNSWGTRLDVAILNAGKDGGCAGIVPEYPSTMLNEQSGFSIYTRDGVSPSRWMTINPQLLAKTEIGFLVFSGKSKENALRRFSSSTESIKNLPCSIVKEMASSIIATDIPCDVTFSHL